MPILVDDKLVLHVLYSLEQSSIFSGCNLISLLFVFDHPLFKLGVDASLEPSLQGLVLVLLLLEEKLFLPGQLFSEFVSPDFLLVLLLVLNLGLEVSRLAVPLALDQVLQLHFLVEHV